MKYEKPKCDCGEELVYYAEKITGRYYKINKSGNPSDRPISLKQYSGGIRYDSLECETCHKAYEIDFKNGKIIRGNLKY